VPPMKRITVRPGVVLNERTAMMHAELERRLRNGNAKFHGLPIIQGSYNRGKVGASGGTHDGGGALDVPYGVPGASADQIELWARRVGFAAWKRPELWVNGKKVWDSHVHMIAIGDPELSTTAKAQETAYIAGYNGLGHLGRGGKDTGPRVAKWHRWPMMRRIAAVALAKKTLKEAQSDLEQWKKTHATD
jgi:hypothetical protein